MTAPEGPKIDRAALELARLSPGQQRAVDLPIILAQLVVPEEFLVCLRDLYAGAVDAIAAAGIATRVLPAFRPDKALAVNLSDLAAMGAAPRITCAARR